MSALRTYQQRAIVALFNAWQAGHKAVVIVLPTGGGKTVVAGDVIWRELQALGVALFVVHRRELVKQTAARFRKLFGDDQVSIIAADEDPTPGARVLVAMCQTLLARDLRPDATLVILDEAHHYAADEWRELAEHYRAARLLGLTATPERADGTPLGDVFERLVVGASYSELIADDFLVPCRVFQPPEETDGLAQDPVLAWQRYAEGSSTFAFTRSVKHAYELADQFRAAGVTAETIEAETPGAARDAILERFRYGATKVITNVAVLTEGVDVPAARCVLLCRGTEHEGLFLQLVGRVLRPYPGKRDAILIDLTGASLRHGLPTEDRVYSLDGAGIRRETVQSLRNCLVCGATFATTTQRCPECGQEHIQKAPRPPRIYSLELREVFAGEKTPEDAKTRELHRLLDIARGRGFALGWVVKEYRTLFGAKPDLCALPEDDKRAEFRRLRLQGAEGGFKPGYAAARFKEAFGHWPSRGWR